MDRDDAHDAPQTDSDSSDQGELVSDELIEEISIDGMCGVY